METSGIGAILYCVMWTAVFWMEAIFRFFVPKSRKDVRGKVVLITGAGRGLGQRMSLEFARLGCTVVGWSRTSRGLASTGHLMDGQFTGSRWKPYVCDVGDRAQVHQTAEKVQLEIGGVDILINNAGIVTGKSLLKCSDDMIAQTLNVNATAHLWTLKEFLPGMLANNSGHVVTISSGSGLFGIPKQCDYVSSKHASVGLNQALSLEILRCNATGIKTTVVCPSYIDTGMFDGVTSVFVPILPANKAAAQIVDGILREKSMLLMPRIVYLLYFLKGAGLEKSAGKTAAHLTWSCRKPVCRDTPVAKHCFRQMSELDFDFYRPNLCYKSPLQLGSSAAWMASMAGKATNSP